VDATLSKNFTASVKPLASERTKPMKLILTTTLCLAASMASATEKECPKQGGGYMCGNVYIDGSKASSSAEAYALAAQQQTQGQQQGQQQGQIATGGNAYNGGNSVNIEGAPALTAGIGINLDIPIARGIQGASCRETVLLAHQLGYHDIALHVLLECPHVRKLNLKINPGDKG
jgi:hypothetical protein